MQSAELLARARQAAVYGRLAPYLLDPNISDILLSASRGLWLDRGGGLVAVPGLRFAEEEVRRRARALIDAGGRHLDEASPIADVQLGEGIRVHAVLAPIAPGGTEISIRLPAMHTPGLAELAERGMCGDEGGRRRLEHMISERRTFLISGATGAGKTTLLAALLSGCSPAERIVTIEDVAELRIDHPHVVGLQSRQSNIEGRGEVGLAELVRHALRMRPDRLIAGECRGPELPLFLSAFNTGHRGGGGTVHANSAADVPARLEALGALAGLEPALLARLVVGAFDDVLHVERRAGVRQITARGRPYLEPDGRLGITVESW